MGRDGKSLGHVASMSMSSISRQALATLGTTQATLVNPLVKLSVIPTSESSTLHLLAVTQAGVSVAKVFISHGLCILALHFDIGIRLYFTTTPDGIVARPSLLALVHVRLPPGYTPTNRISPSTKVHHAYYRKGTALFALIVPSF